MAGSGNGAPRILCIVPAVQSRPNRVLRGEISKVFALKNFYVVTNITIMVSWDTPRHIETRLPGEMSRGKRPRFSVSDEYSCSEAVFLYAFYRPSADLEGSLKPPGTGLAVVGGKGMMREALID